VDVRLAGVLAKQTGSSVVPLIKELSEDGHRDFAMQVEGLELPDAEGSPCPFSIW
jgi:hypothetical protein